MAKPSFNSFVQCFKVARKVAKFQSCHSKIFVTKWFEKQPKWLQIAKSGSTAGKSLDQGLFEDFLSYLPWFQFFRNSLQTKALTQPKPFKNYEYFTLLLQVCKRFTSLNKRTSHFGLERAQTYFLYRREPIYFARTTEHE